MKVQRGGLARNPLKEKSIIRTIKYFTCMLLDQIILYVTNLYTINMSQITHCPHRVIINKKM